MRPCFVQNTLKIDFQYSYAVVALSLILATPFFIFFGKLSDTIGRKKIILAGCLIAALTYIPIFKGITYFGNPALSEAMEKKTIVIKTDKCNDSCSKLKEFLTKKGYNYSTVITMQSPSFLDVSIGSQELKGFDEKEMDAALVTAGYPKSSDPKNINYFRLTILLTILVGFVTMVYGPIAAFLVELFPTKIRYTSMSFPYHIGNGWFGGFLPLIAASLMVKTGNIYAGLYYPIAIALMSVVIGTIFIKESKDNRLDK